MLPYNAYLPIDVWTNPTDQPKSFGTCGQHIDNIKSNVINKLSTLFGFSPTTSTGTAIGIKYLKKQEIFVWVKSVN